MHRAIAVESTPQIQVDNPVQDKVTNVRRVLAAEVDRETGIGGYFFVEIFYFVAEVRIVHDDIPRVTDGCLSRLRTPEAAPRPSMGVKSRHEQVRRESGFIGELKIHRVEANLD